jgi:hypothetical protein
MAAGRETCAEHERAGAQQDQDGNQLQGRDPDPDIRVICARKRRYAR